MKVKGRPKSKNVVRKDTPLGLLRDMKDFYSNKIDERAKGKPYKVGGREGSDIALDRYVESKAPSKKEKDQAVLSALGPKGAYKNSSRKYKTMLKEFSKLTKGTK